MLLAGTRADRVEDLLLFTIMYRFYHQKLTSEQETTPATYLLGALDCRRNPLVTSCSSDVQNCDEMRILCVLPQPFRRFVLIGRQKCGETQVRGWWSAIITSCCCGQGLVVVVSGWLVVTYCYIMLLWSGVVSFFVFCWCVCFFVSLFARFLFFLFVCLFVCLLVCLLWLVAVAGCHRWVACLDASWSMIGIKVTLLYPCLISKVLFFYVLLCVILFCVVHALFCFVCLSICDWDLVQCFDWLSSVGSKMLMVSTRPLK